MRRGPGGRPPWPLGGMRALLLGAVSVLWGSTPSEAQDLSSASLVLQWSPQSQFAGYYVALEKGFYRARGVDLTLVDGGPDVDGVAMLRTGEADFATLFLTGALQAVDEGVPLRLVRQIVNESMVLLVGRKDAGIREVGDLHGRRVSLWTRQDIRAPFQVFFAMNGLQVEVVPQYHSVNLFLRGGVDACAAMRYNELYRLYLAGLDFEDLTVFPIHEGANQVPEDGIYAREDFVREHPDVARAVAEASLEGWRYAAEHPEEALDIVMRRVRKAHIPVSRVQMRWMLESLLPSIRHPDPGGVEAPPGGLSEADYLHTVDLLFQAGVLRETLPWDRFVWDGGG